MGAETSKFMGSIFIQIIVRTCHWSASENENKENVVLTLKEQANKKKNTKKTLKKKNKVKHKKQSSHNIHWNEVHLVGCGEMVLYVFFY